MIDLPQLSEAYIRDWVGERSYERGRVYFLQGAILRPTRQGTILKATCMGSSEKDYRLYAELRHEGIYEANCSCPVGAGGRCKHIAALLLTWLDDADSFVELEELNKVVEVLSKEELTDLVLKMVEAEPDLESLVRLNASAATEGDRTVDPGAIRAWAEQGMVKNQEGLGDPMQIVSNLQPILDLSERYERRGSTTNAATVYRILALTIMDYDLTLIGDEEGYLHGVVWHCVRGIGNCLGSISDSDAREQNLEALFDIYSWDINSGNLGAASPVPDIFKNQTTREERERICHWIEEQLPKGDSWQERYLRHVWGTLWLDLGEDWLDDAAFLRFCRQAGLLAPLVDRLIQTGQVEEAYQEARQASDEDLLSLADLLAERGEIKMARVLVDERSQLSQDRRFSTWLEKHS